MKASKQELLTNLYGWTGAEDGELESLKLAGMPALRILVAAFEGSAPAFDETAN